MYSNYFSEGWNLVNFFGVTCDKVWRGSFGIVANLLDGDIVVNEFELQSHYYVHFRTNTLEMAMNHLIPPAIN